MMWMYLGLFLIGGAAATIPVLGGCPKINTMKNFDLKKYVGKWYEAERFMSLSQSGWKCTTLTYTDNKNGAVSFVYQQISPFDNSAMSRSGTVSQDIADKAKLTHVFPSDLIQLTMDHWIVNTDYKSYAVVRSCINSLRTVRIFTRAQQPEAAVLERAYQVLDKNKIIRTSLTPTDQKNCPK